MPLRKHDPVPEEAMNHISPSNTICETLRGIYHSTDDPDIRLKCRTATAMAKAMTAKLTEYKRNWTSGFWDPNPEAVALVGHRKPIDVLFLCWDDNANTGYRFWQCARMLGLNSVMFKGRKHPFGYPNQAPIHPSMASRPINNAPITVMAPGIESLLSQARIIHLIASTYPLAAFDWRHANVIVQHGGSVYRQNPQACNEIFNPIAARSIIQCPDLLGLGANNESLIYYPVDTDLIQPDFSMKDPNRIVIGHFPSNPKVKGTEAILKVLDRLAPDFPFTYLGSNGSHKPVSWTDNLERMKQCDIIIETCNPDQEGKVYGEWGNTALEAAASGCIVVTNTHTADLYREQYGAEQGFARANTPEELESVLKTLMTASRDELIDLKKQGRRWAEEHHSMQATANRLWDKVYRHYF